MSEEILENQPTPPEETTTPPQEDTPQEIQVETPPSEDIEAVETPEKASELLESKGLDYEVFTKEFQETGELSAESRAKLAKVGLTPEMVDTYIEGQKLLVQKQMEEISSVVGGMDNMITVVEWARANLSQAEKEAYDKIHDPVVIKSILKDLEKRMNDAEGYIPQRQLQGGAGESRGDLFESMAEVEDAINDPRYSKDPVYRNKVARKITASREAGVLEIK